MESGKTNEWSITLECENQKDAIGYLKTLIDAFEMAEKIKEPLNGFFMESSWAKIDCKKTQKRIFKK